jgi:hypothetical protein
MNIIKRAAAAAAAAIATAVASIGFLASGASAAPVQFNVTVQAGHRLLTGAHLVNNEKLHVGLDGFSVTITSQQWNGGGTVAWTDKAFPSNLVGKTFVMTVDGTS